MKKSKIVFASLAASFAVLFSSCNGLLDLVTHNKEKPFAVMDIADAKNVFIAQKNDDGSGTRAASDDKNVIYKILEDGSIEPVKYMNEKGKEMKVRINEPTKLESINEDFIFVGYGDGMMYYNAYLVNKKTGAAYDMVTKLGTPIDQPQAYMNAPTVQTDKKNRAYIMTRDMNDYYPLQVVRIDLSGNDSLRADVYSDPDKAAQNFTVDAEGNMLYTYANENPPIKGSIAKLASTGRIQALGFVRSKWLAPDGNIYYHDSSDYNIYKLNFNNGIEAEKVFPEISMGVENGEYLFTVKGKIIRLTSYSGFVKMHDGDKAPAEISTIDMSSSQIFDACTTENYYYLSGVDNANKNRFVRIDPDTDEVFDILKPNTYEVHTFSADEGKAYTFNGIRMADGNLVIGTVNWDGTGLKILDEDSGINAVYMNRIN